MSLTEKEVVLCNQALSKIGAKGKVIFANQVGPEAEKCILHYEQTRDALLRSFLWNFASGRSQLVLLQTLTLDTAPMPESWAAGTEITGVSSGTTATIFSVTSDTEYKIAYLSDDFTDGEKITDATISQVSWNGKVVYYGDDLVVSFESANELVCAEGYPVVEDNTPDFEWDYQFALPDDYWRMKSNYSDMRWVIEGDLLLTNDSEAEIKYIKKITDPDDFDPLFKEVLILQLALKLLHPLAGTNTTQLKQGLLVELKETMSRARAVCASEKGASEYTKWNDVRYTTGLFTTTDPSKL